MGSLVRWTRQTICGFQNSNFRDVLFSNVYSSSSNPLLIGRMYLKYLFDTEMLPVNLRMDRGIETGKLATIHVSLRNQHRPKEDPNDSIIYGPLTSNKIKRRWFDLLKRTVNCSFEEKRIIQPVDNFLRMFLYQLLKRVATKAFFL